MAEADRWIACYPAAGGYMHLNIYDSYKIHDIAVHCRNCVESH